MDPIRIMLWSVLFPGGLALVVFFLAAKYRATSPGLARLLQGLALIPGLWVPYAMGMGWPAWPPRDATQCLLWLTPVVLISVWLQDLLPHRAAAFVIKVLAVAAVAFGMLQAPIAYEWTSAQSLMIIGGLALAQSLLWTVAEVSFAKLPSWLGPFSVAGVTGFTAAGLAASGSLVLGELQGALALMLTMGLVAVVRWGEDSRLRSLLLAAFFLLTGAFFVQGTYYADLSLISATAFALALPLAALIAARMGQGSGKRAFGALALALLVFLSVGFSVVAYKNIQAAATNEGSEY